MLSQAEIEFLRNPSNFDANYSKSLRHRLNKKVKTLRRELQLLQEAGFVVARNGNWVAKDSCLGEGANRDSFQKRGVIMVRSPGLGLQVKCPLSTFVLTCVYSPVYTSTNHLDELAYKSRRTTGRSTTIFIRLTSRINYCELES